MLKSMPPTPPYRCPPITSALYLDMGKTKMFEAHIAESWTTQICQREKYMIQTAGGVTQVRNSVKHPNIEALLLT